MNWNSFEEFWHMGGHGLYVWGSYAVTLVAMLTEVWLSRRRQVAARRAINEEQQS